MKDADIQAVEFVFWIAYFAEKELRDAILAVEVAVSNPRELVIQKMLDKLHFGDKISLIAELYVENPRKDSFIKMNRKIQDLRNSVAHGRFDELVYKGHHLSDLTGQSELLIDLMNAALKK